MLHAFRSLLLGLATWLLASPLFAAGTVQVVLDGQVDLMGGRRVEFACSAGGRDVAIATQFARGSSAGDVMTYVGRRLKAASIPHYFGADKPTGQPIVLFVENVETIRVRFGGGLRVVLHSMDEMPTGLRVLPAKRRVDVGHATVEANVTLLDARTGDWNQVVVSAELTGSSTAASIARGLESSANGQRLVSQLTGEEAWTATGSRGDGDPVAVSVEVFGYADWGLEFTLTPRVGSR